MEKQYYYYSFSVVSQVSGQTMGNIALGFEGYPTGYQIVAIIRERLKIPTAAPIYITGWVKFSCEAEFLAFTAPMPTKSPIIN